MKKTIVLWSCSGADESSMAFEMAEHLAQKGKTLIAELPCLGIPRLGFVAGIMDRSKNTEAAMVYYEQRNSLPWDMIHHTKGKLSVLPASVFATPDAPVVTKVEMSTLMNFAAALQEAAWRNGYSHVVLDCQGQLTSPMTFFALKAADDIVIPLQKPTEAAYAMASIRRLIQIYKHSGESFLLACAGDGKEIRRIAYDQGSQSAGAGVRVSARDVRKICRQLRQGWSPEQDLAEQDDDPRAEAESSRSPAQKARLILLPGKAKEEKPLSGQAAWSALLQEEGAAYGDGACGQNRPSPDFSVNL